MGTLYKNQSRTSNFYSMKILRIIALFALFFSGASCAGLTVVEQAAKTRGLMLFNQYKGAQSELRIAAEGGDAEAQFYLAEELRKEKQHITIEAYKWYEAAAEQGDFYAMIRLGRKWKKEARRMVGRSDNDRKRKGRSR
jgi:hypothetical protein